jgi:DNA-binding PadR family transcriptional regulator
MLIRYALLILLREQADYGYRLKRRFDDALGPGWQLNVGQVYQSLRSLERAGFVRPVATANADVRPRRVFEITPKGLRYLARWAGRPPRSPRPVRDDTLIWLFVAPRPALLGRLDEEIESHETGARRPQGETETQIWPATPRRDRDDSARGGARALVAALQAHVAPKSHELCVGTSARVSRRRW